MVVGAADVVVAGFVEDMHPAAKIIAIKGIMHLITILGNTLL